jgi:sugar phosphate isomerase/epimerase
MTAQRDALSWGFTTLGCPELGLREVCELAASFQFPEVELRVLERRVDLPQYARENRWTPARAVALFKQHRVRLRVASSDFRLIARAEGPSREAFLDFCDWAETWGATYVRVFGGGEWGKALTPAQFKEAAATVAWWRAERRARGWQVEIVLETHDAFSASEPCRRLAGYLDEPLGIIWDTHHTWRLAGETPEESWQIISPLVRHVHIKDSNDTPSGRHPHTYVLPGDGKAPLGETIGLLRANDYRGAVSFEWERHWHDYLLPLPVALARLREQPWFNAGSQRACSPTTRTS